MSEHFGLRFSLTPWTHLFFISLWPSPRIGVRCKRKPAATMDVLGRRGVDADGRAVEEGHGQPSSERKGYWEARRHREGPPHRANRPWEARGTKAQRRKGEVLISSRTSRDSSPLAVKTFRWQQFKCYPSEQQVLWLDPFSINLNRLLTCCSIRPFFPSSIQLA